MTLSGYLGRLFRSTLAGMLVAIGMAVTASTWASTPDPAAVRNGYEYYRIGDLAVARPKATQPGLMLMGGGRWPPEAFAWLVARGGHGHFVILRASGADELQKQLYIDVGGVASVQTLVFHGREAASDPEVLKIVEQADAIFIAGGDQARYVRFWKGTPLNALLDRHVAQGRPLGGTSAGLAILGGYVYGAMDGGSIASDEGLRDPLGKGVTLVGGFLHLPNLQQVITDTHFDARGRLGRLIAFVARLRHEGHLQAVGLGVDEDAALCVDGEGMGQLFTRKTGFAWLVQPDGQAARVEAAQPLDYPGVRVTGIGTKSRIDMRRLTVQHPAFETTADIRDGQLSLSTPVP